MVNMCRLVALFWIIAILSLVMACVDKATGDGTDLIGPGADIVAESDYILPPDDPETWTEAEWEEAFSGLGFRIDEAWVATADWVSTGTPSLDLFTQISRPLVPAVVPQASHLYTAHIDVDGQTSAASGGDQLLHTAWDGIRLSHHALPAPNCSEVEEGGSWNIASSHMAGWYVSKYPFINTTRGPENDAAQGQCDVWDDPDPPPGGGNGGGEEEDCTWYLVTIWEWDGSVWVIVDQFTFSVC